MSELAGEMGRELKALVLPEGWNGHRLVHTELPFQGIDILS